MTEKIVLTDLENEIFEERAAILEFDGNYTREEAEIRAVEEILAERAWQVSFELYNESETK